jgi:hypothetical protein
MKKIKSKAKSKMKIKIINVLIKITFHLYIIIYNDIIAIIILHYTLNIKQERVSLAKFIEREVHFTNLKKR